MSAIRWSIPVEEGYQMLADALADQVRRDYPETWGAEEGWAFKLTVIEEGRMYFEMIRT